MSNLEVRLNITNYNSHPENPNYTVFHFYREDLAVSFENMLKENNVPYESVIEEGKRRIYLFGISNVYYKKAVELNFLTLGKYREPFIPNRVYGWILIIVVILLIAFAFIGYLNS